MFNNYYEAVLGLLIKCCYIIFETKIIIFNAEAGRKEIVTDALNLFKIFMEITMI